MISDYIVIDVEPDGQEHPRTLWVEGAKFINGEKVEDFYSFNFSMLGKDTLPSFIFVQEVMTFIKDFPCLCYAQSYSKSLLEFELSSYNLDGFINYIGIEDVASERMHQQLSFPELVSKFDLSPKHDGYFYSHVQNIHSIYEILKLL